MENLSKNYLHIKGWGIDADPENEPTYPMKNWTGDDHNRIHYERSVQQPIDREVLHSNERPGVTVVFGTSVPPSGVSGAIRRFAFKFSESEYGHWLSLLLADRINMVEGLVDDISRGHIPNIFKERGWNAELKHNREGFMKNMAISVAVFGVALLWMSSGSKKKKRR